MRKLRASSRKLMRKLGLPEPPRAHAPPHVLFDSQHYSTTYVVYILWYHPPPKVHRFWGIFLVNEYIYIYLTLICASVSCLIVDTVAGENPAPVKVGIGQLAYIEKALKTEKLKN